MDFTDFKGVFIDADKFLYKQDEYPNSSFENVGNLDENDFIITTDKKTSEKSLCKIYNSATLIDGRVEDSPNRSDQPWYAQLQVLRECILLKKLSHPAIIKLIGLNLYNNKVVYNYEPCDDGDVNEDELAPTIFFEYAENKSLQGLINQNNILNLKPVKRQICIMGITAAVRLLHQKNIVHRNLNPGVIWLDKNFYPKIFDFSNSREFSPEEGQSNVTNNQSTKILYLAPEWLEGTFEFGFLNSLDIYSLGRLIYLLTTGVEPFKHQKDKSRKLSDTNLLIKIKTNAEGSIPFFPADMPQRFQDFFKECWSLNPSERPNADDIYDIFINNEFNTNPNDNQESSFLIDKFDEKDLKEIAKYRKMLKDLEPEEKPDIPILLTEGGNFSIELNEESTSEKFERLKKYIKSNSVEDNKDDFFEIIKELAKTNDFYEQGYLPKVMKYINLFLENNSFEALEFIEIAFSKSNFPKINKDISTDKPIETINIPQSVKTIPRRAFANFIELKRVYIPESVETIEEEAFIGCKQLTYISLPNSIKGEKLGKSAFKDCTSLDNIIIPKKLTNIQENTFENNKSLTYITLNQNLVHISDKAFSNCNSLKEITIPDSVTHIGKHAFKPCKNLKTINFKKAANYQISFIKMGSKYNSK